MSRGSTSRIGVDTGGTFTDFVVIRNGRIEIFKELSTPHQPDEAILGETVIADRRVSTPEQIASSDEMLRLVEVALRGTDRSAPQQPQSAPDPSNTEIQDLIKKRSFQSTSSAKADMHKSTRLFTHNSFVQVINRAVRLPGHQFRDHAHARLVQTGCDPCLF